MTCLPRARGQVRRKLDGLEQESSRFMLLCVKRFFSSTVAARVGDVLHDVCLEWTRYLSVESANSSSSLALDSSSDEYDDADADAEEDDFW